MLTRIKFLGKFESASTFSKRAIAKESTAHLHHLSFVHAKCTVCTCHMY